MWGEFHLSPYAGGALGGAVGALLPPKPPYVGWGELSGAPLELA